MYVSLNPTASRPPLSAGQVRASQNAAATAPLCQRWQAEAVDHFDVLWEDHGVVSQQRLRQEEEDNETGMAETTGRHLSSAVNGLPMTNLMLRGSQYAAAAAPLCQRLQAEAVDHIDVLWEDHGDLITSPLQPLVSQQRLRQEEEENETGMAETTGRHLSSAGNGLPRTNLMLRGSQYAAAAAPLCQRLQAETVDHIDVLWEDYGDLIASPLQPLVSQQRLRPEEENETGIGETTGRHLPSTVNGLPMTTLMLRGLPARMTQEALLRFLPGPDVAKYNLLHVPQKKRGTPSSRFAFLNFETHRDAVAFCRQWHGCQIQILTGGTVCGSTVINIEVAQHQGLVAQLIEWLAAIRGRSMPATLPAVFRDGQRQEFWQYVRSMQTRILGLASESDADVYILRL